MMASHVIKCEKCGTELGMVDVDDGVDPAQATSGYRCPGCRIEDSGYMGPSYWLAIDPPPEKMAAGSKFPVFKMVLEAAIPGTEIPPVKVVLKLEHFVEDGEGETRPTWEIPPLEGTTSFTVSEWQFADDLYLPAKLTGGKFFLVASSDDPKFGGGISTPFEVV